MLYSALCLKEPRGGPPDNFLPFLSRLAGHKKGSQGRRANSCEPFQHTQPHEMLSTLSLVQYKMGLKGGRFLTQNGPEGLVGGGCWGVIISMENAEKLSREQIEGLLEASQEIQFKGKDRGEMYRWITRTLSQQRYREQGKPMRGLLLRYVSKLTGRSRTQVTRLVSQYMKDSEVKQAVYQRHRFASRFTRGDLEMLARVDEAHETMSGPATKRILNREYEQYQHAEYERLA